MNENALIYRLKQSDMSAYNDLFLLYKDSIYNTSLGFLQNEKDAEDILQEVFVEVYLSISKFRGESNLGTWLYRICVNKSLEHIRRNNRKKRFSFSLKSNNENDLLNIADWVHPGVIAEQKDNAKHLFKAIKSLPEKQLITFTLHKIECLSHKEIADITNQSISAVETQIHRAKKSLEVKLKEIL